VDTSRTPTIYDVAARAGVSKSLVSLVLRGAQGVSEKRRIAVLNAISELGYRPSAAATALAGNRTHTIGVLIDDYTNMWFVNMIRGMDDALSGRRYSVVVADVHLNAHLGQSPVAAFISMRVDGLVLATEPDAEMVELLTTGGRLLVPTVVAGGRAAHLPGADIVAVDEPAGARLAVAHLIGHSHTFIGHLTGRGGSAINRRRGYEEAMTHAGLTPVVLGEDRDTTEDAGYRSTHELLNRHPAISAIFAANDSMAAGALAALRERGLRTPADVSVVGFDNSPLASSRLVDITTIDDRGLEVGARTAQSLLNKMADPGRAALTQLVEPSFVSRSSTGAAPAS
jgi:DNA-binding LacI/PurR family transcriptional regulator